MEFKKENYNGKEIFFAESKMNEAKSIALFHGYSFESSVWEKIGLVSNLNKVGYDVYAFDMPSFPKSRNKHIDVETFFSFFSSFAKKFGKISILGASAGGHLAAKFSESNSNLVENLILVGAVGLEEINLPESIKVIGIWGSEDNIYNPSLAQKEIARLGGKFYLIKGARHACYLDKPDDFNKILLNELKYSTN